MKDHAITYENIGPLREPAFNYGCVGARREHEPDILLRPSVVKDEPCVISNFLRSFRTEGVNEHMTNAVYFERYTPSAIAIAHGEVVVAANPDDPWQIYGWLAVETRAPLRVGYAYVKSPFRRMGIFTRLLEHVNPGGGEVLLSRTGRLFVALRDRFSLTFQPGDRP